MRKTQQQESLPMAKKKRLIATHLFDLAPVLAGRHLIHVTVGPAREPVLLSLEQPPDYRVETSHGSFSRDRAASPNRFRIHHLLDNSWYSVDLAPTTENYHFVQPLPKGRWLLVRARAAGDGDRNACAHEPDGSLAFSFHAGDGIADVQVTDQGHAWISYFDEGIFSNVALGNAGLVSLDPLGRPVFRFADLADPVVQCMADCYALNVCSGKEVWLYYYTHFPLVGLLEGTIAGCWFIPVTGSHGFAVDGGRVLLGGSYDRRDSLFLGELATLKFRRITPTDEAGNPFQRFRAFGRGRLLFLATESALHVVDLRLL
jgi:hypothetical protein